MDAPREGGVKITGNADVKKCFTVSKCLRSPRLLPNRKKGVGYLKIC